MLKRDPQFSRLPVRGRSFMGTSSYWLGPDHLLVVRIGGFVERYQRFSYRDIQALIIQRTRRYARLNIFWGILLAPFLLLAWLGGTHAHQFGWVGAIIVGLLLGINLWKGPTCTCRIQTAVQTDLLPGLNRLRQTRRIVARLKTRLDQAQTAEPVATT